MLNRNGQIKLIDFGSSYIYHTKRNSSMETYNNNVGEKSQCDSHADLNQRTDRPREQTEAPGMVNDTAGTMLYWSPEICDDSRVNYNNQGTYTHNII